MDLLKAAMAESKQKSGASWKKKRAADSSSDDDDAPKKKKYMRRGELKKLNGEDASDEEAEAKVVVEASKVEEEEEEDDAEDEHVDPDVVKRKLRSYSQPVTIFGESHRDRLKRLKLFEMDAHERHGGSMGTGHELQAIIAQEVDNDIMQATLAALDQEGQQQDTDEQKKARAKKERAMQRRHNKYAEMKEKEKFDCVEDYIIFFFKRMLLVWEEELMGRDAEDKKSTKGKVASATQKQTRQYLKPLFSELKKKACPKDVVRCTEIIVTRCIEREYVKANESYLKMAIGNAAWPMGVTMVGIHERAGREKIFSQNVAHVLNNERSRKYIQGIKRIMTFCQHAYPNVPSKMVI